MRVCRKLICVCDFPLNEDLTGRPQASRFSPRSTSVGHYIFFWQTTLIVVHTINKQKPLTWMCSNSVQIVVHTQLWKTNVARFFLLSISSSQNIHLYFRDITNVICIAKKMHWHFLHVLHVTQVNLHRGLFGDGWSHLDSKVNSRSTLQSLVLYYDSMFCSLSTAKGFCLFHCLTSSWLRRVVTAKGQVRAK